MASITYPFRKHRGAEALPLIALLVMLILWGCGGTAILSQDELEAPPAAELPPMRHTIQVGAFSNMDNAVRLTAKLQAQGLNAYHFLHDSGLYKVRFGNYPTKNAALARAEYLKGAGIIDVYYIVGPNDYTASANRPGNRDYLRIDIVTTAQKYVGIPYKWGGESPRTGFDCSGLTMVVYRLNGLQLPRSSRAQWQAGRSVNRSQLQKGDLVFFATSGGQRVSHVGIYAGNNKFLHAPGKNRKIRMSSLSSKYYRTRYLGARTYL
ncbi:MAG: C40 family peptidase [Desulfobacterales bacterium]|nr:MAG: C40 family peptidase [Desulfobacterales bacterium]